MITFSPLATVFSWRSYQLLYANIILPLKRKTTNKKTGQDLFF
ncbi:hypothetical protein LACWKB10_0703 [Lactobacillus sp. wkB10]|nr:hypothetical protein LACWKB10_0703 [Lactobacillus sp. wkB10]